MFRRIPRIQQHLVAEDITSTSKSRHVYIKQETNSSGNTTWEGLQNELESTKVIYINEPCSKHVRQRRFLQKIELKPTSAGFTEPIKDIDKFRYIVNELVHRQ